MRPLLHLGTGSMKELLWIDAARSILYDVQEPRRPYIWFLDWVEGALEWGGAL